MATKYLNIGSTATSVTVDINENGNILPSVNNTYNLGSSSYKWANIYSTTFTGALNGNASSATALTSSAGSSTLPIYFSSGKPVSCSSTLAVSITGNADTVDSRHASQFVYDNGILTSASFSDVDSLTTEGVYHCQYQTASNYPPIANHGTFFYEGSVGTPYQLYIPDSSHMYIYKRYYSSSSSTWSSWSKIYAGYADSAGNATNDSSGNIISSTYVKKAGDTMTGTLTMESSYIWVQGGSAQGSNTNRLATTSGMAGNMQAHQGRRGTQIYANGIGFADPYGGANNTDSGWIRHVEETANAGYLELGIGDDTASECMYARQYNTSGEIASSITLLDTSSNQHFNTVYFGGGTSYYINGANYNGTSAASLHSYGYWESMTSITSRLTSLNIDGFEAGTTGRAIARLDLATSSVSDGTLPHTISSGYLQTYGWDGSTSACSQFYIPNGDHIGTSNGPERLSVRGHDGSSWTAWKDLAFYTDITNYALPLSGGTLSGNLYFTDCCSNTLTGTSLRGVYGHIGTNDGWRIAGGDLNGSTNSGFLEISTCDDGTEPIYVRQYNNGGNWSAYSNLLRTVTLMDENGYSTFIRGYGAVWNDYAEYRKVASIEPGRCVREDKSGTMQLTTKRLEKGCEIISDTFGFAIGETDDCKTPIATTGRVLAYTDKDRNTFELGAPVCSGPDGTVSMMTDEEERMYPSRIIGTVSEIPNYEEWGTGHVKVNNRIWIRIR